MGNEPQRLRQRPEGALLRTYLQAAGIAPESFGKPLIGVATCSSQIFLEKPMARDLGPVAMASIEAAGGLAVQWDTTRSPDMMSWGHADGYSFAWRDQLADLIESWVRQETLDGLVLIGDAPESLVGMAMAAIRVNVPAVIVPINSGQKEFVPGVSDATKRRKLSDPYRVVSEYLFGKKRSDEMTGCDDFSDFLLRDDDHESNAVSLALDALGVCLPGISSVSTTGSRFKELVCASAERVMALVNANIPLRRYLTTNAFLNASRASAALGGSIDVAVHLMALAHEAGVALTLDMFDQVARQTPQVASLGGVCDRPASRLDEFDEAGGIWAVLHTIRDHVLPNNTVAGKGAAELAKSTLVKDGRVIIEQRPHHKMSGLGVLKGNIALNGGFFLLNQVHADLAHFVGPIRVFDQEIEAAKALSEGLIKKKTALVVRCQGPKGGPGLRKLRILPALLESRGLHSQIPVLTDGRLPDTPSGLFISCISPEGATRSLFAVLKDDDQIEINVDSRSISARLTQMEIQVRLARWQAPEIQNHRSFLTRYAKSVSEITDGAILR